MKTITINYPHSICTFQLTMDSDAMYRRILSHFGSLIDNSNFVMREKTRCIDIVIESKKKTITTNQNGEIKTSIFNDNWLHTLDIMIRSNLVFENEWEAYHGSVISKNNISYLLLGESMSGKSTLTTYLIKKEKFKLVSEDIVILNYKTGDVCPVIRNINLRKKGYHLLLSKNVLNEKDCEYADETDRYIFSPARDEIICSEEQIIKKCFILHLNKEYTGKKINKNFFVYLINSYIENMVNKKVKPALTLIQNIPTYDLYYYELAGVASLME